MNIYTIFSQSHKPLLDIFIKTLFEVEPSCRLTVKSMEQKGDGDYNGKGFLEMCLPKTELIIDAIKKEMGVHKDVDYFLYCDCDIIFLKPFLQDLKHKILIYRCIKEKYPDLLAQKDYDNPLLLCAGFMVIKASEKTLQFFEKVLEIQKKGITINGNETLNDQHIINGNRDYLNWSALDNTFASVGMFTGWQVWDNEQEIIIPEETKLIHLNWIQGYKNKIKLANKIIKQ